MLLGILSSLANQLSANISPSELSHFMPMGESIRCAPQLKKSDPESEEIMKQFSKSRLRKYLRHYAKSKKYLESFETSAFRIDLFGNNCEELTAEHKEFAAKTLREIFAKTKKKKPHS